MTALEDQREDQALGAAWRRVEAALPEGWRWMGVDWRPDSALELNGHDEDKRWQASIWHPGSQDRPITSRGPTPLAALEALADALEAGR